ncbi:hypothetical protein AK812_SmicGene32560 [Symbiodinium microadriaticum]|uniref:Uncharacterized protein n=1 Tax=Symbiodinium microadriaticum TaxID=2951 RepID=A0A1Q9CTS7_SYMMI|nr:hypothetical protein AK812_SmicGene32560 [Symbiodinium microadriaticum]
MVVLSSHARTVKQAVEQEKKKANAIMTEVVEKRQAAAVAKLVSAPWDRFQKGLCDELGFTGAVSEAKPSDTALAASGKGSGEEE